MGRDARDDRGHGHGRHRRPGRRLGHNRVGHAGLRQIRFAEGHPGKPVGGQAAGAEVGLTVKAGIVGTGHEARGAEALRAGEILGLFQGAAGDGGNAQRLDVAGVGRAPVEGQLVRGIGGHRLQRAGDGLGGVRPDRDRQRRVKDLIVGNDQHRVQVGRHHPRLVAQRGKPGRHFPARELGLSQGAPAMPVATFKQDRLLREAHGKVGRRDMSVHGWITARLRSRVGGPRFHWIAPDLPQFTP